MSKVIFHLLANAHLDPVWLWDWQEGLNEGLTTCKTMLEIMRKRTDFTFIRGEASIYDHIEKTDPKTFAEIRKRVKEGRWDVVGGNWVQSDTNLPGTTTFLKQFEIGRKYCKDKFDVDVTAAWAADSFGHSAGLPEIYAASGLKYLAFSRPGENLCPIGKPAFWWRGQGDAEILCYRIPGSCWYGSDRDEIARRLDTMLAESSKHGLQNLAVFYGLGNHGGGSSLRQLDDIMAWAAAHPDIKVEFSTLHRFFAMLEKEVKKNGRNSIPTFSGELNYCLRGCYSSVAKYKFMFRQAEAAILRAERTAVAVNGSLRLPPVDFNLEWQGVLFGTFHDILPGTSIERAFEEQMQWLGGVIHGCREKEFATINALARQLDTRVKPVKGDNPCAVPFVLFNPLPYEYHGYVELEASLDYRPIRSYIDRVNALPVELLDGKGKPLPFQTIETEHQAMCSVPWRKRIVFPVTLPPFGWRQVSIGYQENPLMKDGSGIPAAVMQDGTITNGIYRVEAVKGAEQLKIYRHNQPVFATDGIVFALYYDPWGAWGGMGEQPEAFMVTKRVEIWKITNLRIQENGPERVSLWIEFSGRNSKIQLTVRLCRNRDAVDCQARIIWNDRAVRLKMAMTQGDEVVYDIPGGVITRKESGDVPGGRWVKIRRGEETVALAGDGFYCYDNENGEFGVTICRGSLFAFDAAAGAAEYPDRPAADQGILKCRFVLTGVADNIPILAEQLELPPTVLAVDRHPGKLADGGSLMAVSPSAVKLLDLKFTAKNEWVVTLQNQSGIAIKALLSFGERKFTTKALPPWRIHRFKSSGKDMKPHSEDVAELDGKHHGQGKEL